MSASSSSHMHAVGNIVSSVHPSISCLYTRLLVCLCADEPSRFLLDYVLYLEPQAKCITVYAVILPIALYSCACRTTSNRHRLFRRHAAITASTSRLPVGLTHTQCASITLAHNYSSPSSTHGMTYVLLILLKGSVTKWSPIITPAHE